MDGLLGSLVDSGLCESNSKSNGSGNASKKRLEELKSQREEKRFHGDDLLEALHQSVSVFDQVSCDYAAAALGAKGLSVIDQFALSSHKKDSLLETTFSLNGNTVESKKKKPLSKKGNQRLKAKQIKGQSYSEKQTSKSAGPKRRAKNNAKGRFKAF